METVGKFIVLKKQYNVKTAHGVFVAHLAVNQSSLNQKYLTHYALEHVMISIFRHGSENDEDVILQ